jgi:hypothetical protein
MLQMQIRMLWTGMMMRMSRARMRVVEACQLQMAHTPGGYGTSPSGTERGDGPRPMHASRHRTDARRPSRFVAHQPIAVATVRNEAAVRHEVRMTRGASMAGVAAAARSTD